MTDDQGSQGQNAAASVDFSGLILGFSSAALYYLGEAPLGGQTAPDKNLPLARQNIDIIEMLQEKTKGNLTDEESKLVDQVLGDLRVKFTEASKG